MIFRQFDETDIVAGRVTRVASGFWPGSETAWSASNFVDNYWALTSSATPSPSYGASVYDVRKTMYYLDIFPNNTYLSNNDPYFSVSYGHIGGDVGSGSFNTETGSIKAAPTKTIYNQYKNILLGTADEDGKFTFKSGSTTVSADEIFVLNFSTYKMKDKIDEGSFEITLTGSSGKITLRDDSPFQTQTLSVYNLISGSVNDTKTTTPSYNGIGLLYPSDGIVVLNATRLNQLINLESITSGGAQFNYTASCINDTKTVNHKALAWSIENANGVLRVRKSEYVPARHYFIRVKNRDFNYSNNPTYVYDGTDGINAKGKIRNDDFISDPRTYITTVGLYNDNNELVAVGKLSRPAIKSFNNELLIQVRLDY